MLRTQSDIEHCLLGAFNFMTAGKAFVTTTSRNNHIGPTMATVFAGAFIATYAAVLVRLARDWAVDPNYSHGFLIVPLAGYLVWERRAAIGRAPVRPSWLGLPVVAVGLLMLAGGTLGAEFFTARVSLIFVLAGSVLFVFGLPYLRILAFPLAILLLMIPLPAIVFNRIAFPLQIFASQFGERVLQLANIPVLREGNVMVLPATTLEVAEACSGIRSLVTLVTLGLVYGYFMEPRAWARVVIVAVTVPIAIVTNGLRVAGTGIAAYRFGPEAAEGFFHTFSGWIVFTVAFGLVCLITGLLRGIGEQPAASGRTRAPMPVQVSR
jgi:exosortase